MDRSSSWSRTEERRQPCSLKKDDATGLNTGIGFCEFYDKQTADEARKMNNKKSINGRAIRIDNPDGGKKGTAAVVQEEERR